MDRLADKQKIGWAVAGWLGLCALTCAAVSLRWPLMGDTTYMHYAVRLMHAGFRPYAAIVDMNMPGSYLLEMASGRIFGTGDLGLRLYDLSLSLSAILLLTKMTRHHLAGFCAGAMLVVVHTQDGVMMAGERDYAMAVLLLLSVFAILRIPQQSSREKSPYVVGPLIAGTALGAAICIKPTAIVFLPLLVGWPTVRRGRPILTLLVSTCIAPALCWWWLARWNATHAFLSALHGLVPYHASLNNKPLLFLLTHSISPIGALFTIWIIGLLIHRHASRDEWMLYLSAVCGWICYAVQRKGFSYQRYAMLAFLLLAIASSFGAWIQNEKRALRWIGIAGIATALGMGAVFAARVTTYSREHPEASLAADIAHFGSNGQTQCMDTAGPCIAAMERLQQIQPTGLLYDCYLTRDDSPVALDLRKHFLQAIAAKPPKVILITNSVCYGEPNSFEKYRNWPEFATLLTNQYTLSAERVPTAPVRYWSRATVPFAWRIYTHR